MLVGRKPVLDALEGGTRLEKVWMETGMRGELEKYVRKLCRENRVPLQYVPKQKLSALSSKALHQGLVAQLAIVEYCNVDELVPLLFEQGRVPFILVLDGVEDVRNFGALARSAVWFDCDAIVIPSKRSAMLNSFAYKASAGAVKDIQICRESRLVAAVEYMKASGIRILVAEASSDKKYEITDFAEPIALVLGSESKGVTNELKQLADGFISIEGSGRVESLNVSVAGAILMNKIYSHRINQK